MKKVILILSLIFTSWFSFGDVDTSCKFRLINLGFLKAFEIDLRQQVKVLVGNIQHHPDLFSISVLKPTDNFRHANRYLLLSKFMYLPEKNKAPSCRAKENHGDRCIFLTSEYIAQPIMIDLAKDYIQKTEAYFNLTADFKKVIQIREWLEPDDRQNEEVTYCGEGGYSSPEESEREAVHNFLSRFKDGRLFNEKLKTTAGRQWFDTNIKPILENMIMVHNLFYGEYDHY